jgi:UDP-glucose-4-epimerase GalE
MNVLVTGGAGYVGSHACKALAEAGYTPVTYDNLVYGHKSAVKWGPFVEGDVLDRVRLDEILSHYRPKAVMHFAAYAYVGESVENPRKYYRNNVGGSFNLLEAMTDHGVDKIIFSSSCSTYGIPVTERIAETHRQEPINPYGFTKLVVERMLSDLAHAQGMKYAALRYFNAAGADGDGEIGEQHDPETHLIPRVLEAALGIRECVDIYGTDYPTPDGTAIRDYIHVTDLAQAHVRALERLTRGGESVALNLGVGRGYSVREVIAAARRVTGRVISVRELLRRPGDPPVLVADPTLARKELDWAARHTTIEEMVDTAWRWLSRSQTAASDTKHGSRAT